MSDIVHRLLGRTPPDSQALVELRRRARAAGRYQRDHALGIERAASSGSSAANLDRVRTPQASAGHLGARLDAFRAVHAADAAVGEELVPFLRHFAIGGATYAVVASRAGCHQATAKKRVNAALDRLAEHYEKAGGGPK